jgi:outer membrane protein assembly factor BamB
MSQTKQVSDQPVPEVRRGPNYIALGVILIVLASLFGVTRMLPDDASMRTVSTIALGLLSGMVIWLWFAMGRVFAPPGGRRVFVGGVVVIVATVGLGFALYEDVSFSGDMMPTPVRRAFWRAPAPEAIRTADAVLELDGDKSVFGAAGGTNVLLEYPQFLGPDRMPMIEGVKIARNWKESPPKLLWKQPIGEGWSAFAVFGDLAVTQEQRGEEELVTCYRLTTGDKVWEHSDAGRFSETLGGDGPRATPTIAEYGPVGFGGNSQCVVTLGAFGQLNCLDLRTGKPLWPARNILKDADAKNLVWAMAGSPLVYDGMIVVSPGGMNGKSLAAYDLMTGEPRWFAGNSVAAYCSPALMTVGGVKQVVIVNQKNVTGHDATTGAVLWEHPWPGEQPKVSQPIAVAENRVFCSTGYAIGCMLLELAPNGGKFTTTDLYGGRNANMKTKFTNVAIRDGKAYGLDDGILECLDIETGKKLWKEGRFGHGQILMVDDLLLVLAESGEMVMLEVNPKEMVELGRFQALEGKTWNNPVLVGPYLLLRNDHEAACFKVEILAEPKEEPAPQEGSESGDSVS